MNYIDELNAFDIWRETNQLTSNDIVLWYALMHIANRAFWPDRFQVAIARLEAKTALGRSALYRSRNKLKQVGRIDFKDGDGSRSATYSINPFCVPHADTMRNTNGTENNLCPSHGHKANTIRNTNRTQSETQSGPLINKDKDENDHSCACADRFAHFYAAYPKKRSKADAEKAWKKINPDDELFQRIMQALNQAKTSPDWTKDGGQFIPYPASWLRAQGWEDDYSPPPPTPSAPRRKLYRDYGESGGTQP